MRETWLELVCPCPRANNGCLRSIIHQFISFPLLRRPSFVIVPSWVACWVRAFNESFVVMPWRVTCVTANNGFLRSIIFLSFRTPGTLTFITSLPRALWCRRWQSWGSPCNQTHHWSWSCCDSVSSPESFCVLFDITSEQSVELKWLMLNKPKRWFHSSRVKLPLVSMSASWFLVSMYLTRITAEGQLCGSWKHVSYNNLEYCFVVFKHIQQSFLMRELDVWGNTVNIIQNIGHSSRLLACAWHASRQTTGFTVLSWFWVVFPRTTTIRSHKSRDDFGFCWTVWNWSLFLTYPTYWNKCMTSQNT